MVKKKAVEIEFRSTQNVHGEESSIMQMISGVRTVDEGDTVLLFSEKWEGMDEDIHTRLTIKGDSVVVKREGPVSTVMEFERDSDTLCEYNTKAGSLDFVITTNVLKIIDIKEVISIRIFYDMFSNGALVSKNTLYIEAK